MRRRSYVLRIMVLAAAVLVFSQSIIGSVSTAAAATGTFGNLVIGSATDSPGDGYKFGSVYSLSEPGTAQSFSFYARGGRVAQRVIPVVYRVQAGRPTTLVARGAEAVIPANQSGRWINSSLPAVALASGDYLLGLLSGPSGAQASIHYSPGASRGIWNANPYGTPASSWGNVNRDDSAWSVYVTYTSSTSTPAPANTAPPAVSGTPQKGATLSASNGSWSGNPSSYAYQWQRCQGSACTAIGSATQSTYAVSDSDVGSTLLVVVTATNTGGSASASSARTATVTTPGAAPANNSPPTITGTAQAGSTLTATLGTWSGNPQPTLSAQWQTCQEAACTDIGGAIGTTYTVRAGDVGRTLRIVVSASNSSGSATSTSQPTATVTSAPAASSGSFGYTVPGAQTDAAGEGYKFGSVHQLDRTATLTNFRWYVRGGSHSQSFVPIVYGANAAGQPTGLVLQGQPVTIAAGRPAGWATAPLPAGTTLAPGNYLLGLLSGPGGQGALNYYDIGPSNAAWWNANPYPTPTQSWGALNTSDQRWSFYVEYGSSAPAQAPVNQTAPSISGSAVVGQTLTASAGTWTNGPEGYAYQWLRCQGADCPPIPGAASSTYLVAAADEGRTLKVAVTASNSGGSGQATSAPTAAVAAAGGGGGPQPSFTKVTIDPNPIGSLVEKAFADIDGNGKLDAVVGMQESPSQGGSGGIFWYRFPTSGRATDPWTRHTILPSGRAYEDMASLDVDGDGRVDIVASVDTRIYWYRNPGTLDGAWQQTLIGAGHGENNIAIGDLDGDGKPDVATNAIMFFQNSPSSWTAVTYNDTYNAVALLDVGSGLGRVNIVGNAPTPPYDIVWFENPRERGGNARTGSWVRRTVGRGYGCPGGSTECETVATVETADLNRDGRMDVVSGQAEGDPVPPGGLRWFEAPVNRTQPWTERTIDAGFESTHNVRAGDMDGNGTQDLVAGEQDQSPLKRVAVFFNDGAGNFTRQIVSNDASHNVVVGDVDGDGDSDFLAGPHGWFGGPHPLQLYLNTRL